MNSLLKALIFLLFLACAASARAEGEITVYSGRGKTLVGPLIEQFEAETGIEVKIRYGGSAEMAATILEEGDHSPADVFFSQDAGALGALATEGKLAPLPREILDLVEARFRSPENLWVGTSGRARVVVYNTSRVKPGDLPDSILGFTDPKWKGRLGWAPTNGSFQTFVTAMRLKIGEDRTRDWLKGILANKPKVYPKNSPIVQAAGAGEIDAGFVNHYYLFRFLEEQGEEFGARNAYNKHGDVGALINVAGVAILKTAANPSGARGFIEYLLSPDAQTYYANKTYEYPLIEGVEAHPLLKPLKEIDTPEIDLSSLKDLQGTLKLLQEVGALE